MLDVQPNWCIEDVGSLLLVVDDFIYLRHEDIVVVGEYVDLVALLIVEDTSAYIQTE